MSEMCVCVCVYVSVVRRVVDGGWIDGWTGGWMDGCMQNVLRPVQMYTLLTQGASNITDRLLTFHTLRKVL